MYKNQNLQIKLNRLILRKKRDRKDNQRDITDTISPSISKCEDRNKL